MRAVAVSDEALEIDVRTGEDGRAVWPVTFLVSYEGELLAVGRATYVRVADDHPALPEPLRRVAAALPFPTDAEEAAPAAELELELELDAAAAVVERLHAAWRGLEAGVEAAGEELAELVAPDAVWHVPGNSPVAGTYRGPAGVLGYLAGRRARVGSALEVHSGGLLADGRHAVHFTTGCAYRDGFTYRWDTAGIYRVAGDQIVAAWLIPLDQPAFDRIWSAPPLAA